MASPLVFRGTQCVSCTRHITGSLESAFQLSRHQQVRGIKKLVKVSTTKVHLLRNIPKYGAKGLQDLLIYHDVVLMLMRSRNNCLGTIWYYAKSLVSPPPLRASFAIEAFPGQSDLYQAFAIAMRSFCNGIRNYCKKRS